MIDNFILSLDDAIERVSAKPDWRRTLVLWDFRTPRWIKALLGTGIACGLALTFILAIFS